jgi:hypothetical protein
MLLGEALGRSAWVMRESLRMMVPIAADVPPQEWNQVMVPESHPQVQRSWRTPGVAQWELKIQALNSSWFGHLPKCLIQFLQNFLFAGSYVFVQHTRFASRWKELDTNGC